MITKGIPGPILHMVTSGDTTAVQIFVRNHQASVSHILLEIISAYRVVKKKWSRKKLFAKQKYNLHTIINCI